MIEKFKIVFADNELDPIFITIKKDINGYRLTSPITVKEKTVFASMALKKSKKEIFDWIEHELLFKYKIKEIQKIEKGMIEGIAS